ncbi:hypothetical protein MMC17_005615 [Xylographa soralifera]|nr:hypothetical protein [Xylographa soralifera]
MGGGLTPGTKAPPGSFREKPGASRSYRNDAPTSTAFVFTDSQSYDDLYVLPRQRTLVKEDTTVRPRTASSPPRKSARESIFATLPEDGRLAHQPNIFRPAPSHSLSIQAPKYSEDTAIGIAIGSPSQNLFPPLLQDIPESMLSFADRAPISFVSSQSDTREDNNVEEAVKQKGKWKMFGSLFGKKGPSNPVSPASPFYNLQYPAPDIVNLDNRSPHEEIAPPRNVAESRQQQTTTARDLDLIRAATKKKVLSKKRKEDTKPEIRKTRTTNFFHSVRRTPSKSPIDDGGSSPLETKPMMLRVDIPDVSMDRYSIMFSQVLKPEQPSLMVRRQAQLEKLKTIGDTKPLSSPGQSMTNLQIPVRRATSPSPRSMSPSFSLFPAPQLSSKRVPSPLSLVKPSPLHRSATAPGALSPARAAFESSTSISKGPTQIPATIRSPAQSPETPASAHGPKWSSDISASTDASPIDDSDHDHALAGKLLPISKFSSSARADSPFRPPDTSTKNTNKSQLSRKFSGARQLDKTTHNARTIANPLSSSPPSAAEISIARQISVSRRQQLLVPITPKTARQPMQATLVDVNKHAESAENTDGRGHISRKSQHALLEFA